MTTTRPTSGSYTHTMMAKSLPDAAVTTVLLCFYVVGISGFLAILASGATLLYTQYQLKALADRQHDELAGPDPSDYVSFDDGVLEDGLHATSLRSAKAIALKRVRSSALFGPILTSITMLAIPLCLLLNNVGDIPFRVLLSTFLILLIHFSNVATLHSYFQLVQGKETVQGVEDGSRSSLEFWTPQEELARSSCLLWLYLRILFTLCGKDTKKSDGHSDLAGLNVAKLPQFPKSVRVAFMRRSSSLLTTPLLANEATMPQYTQADHIATSDTPPFFVCDRQTLPSSLHDHALSDSDSVTSIELGRQVGT